MSDCGIDGSEKNPTTAGYICNKVRGFGDRIYGPDRLLHPGVRKGRKGEGRFERASWEEAIELIAQRMEGFGQAGHAGDYEPLSLEEMREGYAAATAAA